MSNAADRKRAADALQGVALCLALGFNDGADPSPIVRITVPHTGNVSRAQDGTVFVEAVIELSAERS